MARGSLDGVEGAEVGGEGVTLEPVGSHHLELVVDERGNSGKSWIRTIFSERRSSAGDRLDIIAFSGGDGLQQ